MCTLSFASINILDDLIIEVIPHEGIEINAEMADEFQQLINNSTTPNLVLVNRRNTFSHSFEAISKIRNFKNIKARVILSTRRSSTIATESLLGDINELSCPTEICSDRDTAINWLLSYA